MTGTSPSGTELNTWKEISAYLGVSIRTAQQYENELALPVHRLAGRGKPRVRALSSELDEWKSRQKLAPQRAGPISGIDSPADSVRTWSPSFRSATVGRFLYLGIPLLALAALASFWVMSRHRPISDFLVRDRNVIALDSRGRELWRHAFPWDLREGMYMGTERQRHYWIGELAASTKRQIIFAAVSYHEVDTGTPVLCLGADGKVAWQFIPGHSVEDAGGNRMVPPYLISILQVAMGKIPGETRIVVSSNHYLGEANQVAMLDVNGRVVAEYWHPGHLLHLEQIEFAGDGHKTLLLGGVNNGNHQATLVVLDPLKMSGVVTPKTMQDHRFELLNMAPANEAAVVFFPRSCISAGQPYTRVSALHVNKDRIVLEVSEGALDHGPGFLYELDYGLHVVNVVPTDAGMVEKIHRDLQAQGKLTHSFSSEQECARLRAGVTVRRVI